MSTLIEEIKSKHQTGEYNFWYVDPYSLDLHGKPSKFKMGYAKFMNFWAIFGEVFLLIQVIHIFTYQDSTGVSAPAFFVYAFASIVWIIYARFVLSRKNMPLIVSNVLDVLLSILVIVGVFVF